MQEELFNLIVTILKSASNYMGISYEKLSILCYCIIAPLIWASIYVLRRRSFFSILFTMPSLVAIYLFFKGDLQQATKLFYDANIKGLHFFAAQIGMSYVEISLILSVLIPLGTFILLGLIPRVALSPIYVMLNTALFIYLVAVFIAF